MCCAGSDSYSIIYCGVSVKQCMFVCGVESCCQFSESKQHCGNAVAKWQLGNAAHNTTVMTSYHQRCKTKGKSHNKPNKDHAHWSTGSRRLYLCRLCLRQMFLFWSRQSNHYVWMSFAGTAIQPKCGWERGNVNQIWTGCVYSFCIYFLIAFENN